MSKKLNFWYGSIFGTYWMVYAVVNSFASVFLLARGFSNSAIGITLATANVLAVIMQPLTADLADRSSKVGPIGITSIMTIMMMVFVIGMFAMPEGGAGLGVVFVLLIGWHTVLQPLYNALTFKLEETGLPVNFGVARSVGSLAYSILVVFLGILVENIGIIVIPFTAEITCAMMLASLLLTKRTFDQAMRKKNEDAGKGASETGIGGSDHESGSDDENIGLVKFIRRNRLFFVLNLGVVGIFFSNATLNNYMMQIVANVGGTSKDMGSILAIMAFLEIPAMVFFGRIRRKFSCNTLLKVASVGFTAKILMCWIANSVATLFAAQFFQLISFALFLPAMVYFTGENMSKGEAVKGQALFTTMITATTIFASLAGGLILDVSGAKTLTLIATIATAAGAVVLFAVVDKIGKNR